MYPTLLTIHSVLRWLVIFAGVGTVVNALRAVNGPAAPRPGLMFVILIDTQVTVGFFLYLFLSPITQAAMQDMGGVMASHAMRFWAVEHPFGMILALALVHVGRVIARAQGTTVATRRRAAICFAVALVIVLVSIPWPFMPYGRPLL